MKNVTQIKGGIMQSVDVNLKKAIEYHRSFARKGKKPEKWVLCRNRGLLFFITLQFNHICCVCRRSKVSFNTFRLS